MSAAAVPAPAAIGRGRSAHRTRLLRLLSVVVLLLVWEFGTRLLGVPAFVLPPPSAIAEILFVGLRDGLLLRHTWVTAQEILFGYLLGSALGIGLGVLVSQYRIVEDLVYPYIIALNSVPRIAVSPLIVVWFGTGFQSKVIIAALVSFFPLLVSVLIGFKSVDREQVLLMRALTASRWQTFRMVTFPNALPSIFGGLEIAIVLSVVGAIVGEFVGARAGLGYYILLTNSRLNTAGMFAAFIVLALLGTVLNLAVRTVARRVVFWRDVDVLAQA